MCARHITKWKQRIMSRLLRLVPRRHFASLANGRSPSGRFADGPSLADFMRSDANGADVPRATHVPAAAPPYLAAHAEPRSFAIETFGCQMVRVVASPAEHALRGALTADTRLPTHRRTSPTRRLCVRCFSTPVLCQRATPPPQTSCCSTLAPFVTKLVRPQCQSSPNALLAKWLWAERAQASKVSF